MNEEKKTKNVIYFVADIEYAFSVLIFFAFGKEDIKYDLFCCHHHYYYDCYYFK